MPAASVPHGSRQRSCLFDGSRIATRATMVANLSAVSESLKTARNVAIIVLIAAAVYFLPGGGRAANTFEAVLWVAFGIGHRLPRLARLPRTPRGPAQPRRSPPGLLYGGIAGAVFVCMARMRMWDAVARAASSCRCTAGACLGELAVVRAGRLSSSTRWSRSTATGAPIEHSPSSVEACPTSPACTCSATRRAA